MIPKIIHYCWFGGEKPDSVLQFIEGWRKKCPDYEIKEWNENNFDINEAKFARESYAAKKWAFVSDYVRFAVLEQYGGIYLDTDIELLKSLDSMQKEPGYVGFEVHGVAAGVIACEAHNPIIRAVLETYQRTAFINKDGTYNLLTSPDYISNELVKVGFVRENIEQHLKGMTVYPSEWFYPYTLVSFQTNITENTVAIHHYAGSWLDEKSKYQLGIQKKLKWIPVKRLAIWISVAISETKYNGVKGLLYVVSNRLRRTR